MQKDIKELDCSKMVINPANPQMVKWFESNVPMPNSVHIEEFKGFTKAMVYKYVLLMYDPNSHIQQMHSLDWWNKKNEAANYAGFQLHKGKDGYYRFHEKVDEFIFGKNDSVNDVIIHFLAWMNNYEWMHMVYLRESHMQYVKGGLNGNNIDVKSTKEARQIWSEINDVANKMANINDETQEFRSRFYYQIEQSRLAIRPEDYARALSEGADLRSDSPYGVNYVVDKPKFLGDHVPDKV